MVSIPEGPHYQIPATELATWLDREAAETWWNVDGDPLLTGRLSFPCPTDELTAELRAIGGSLLLQAPIGDSNAKGQILKADQIGAVVIRFDSKLPSSERPSLWADERLFYLCWKGSPHEWLLVEDSVTAKQFEVDKTPLAK